MHSGGKFSFSRHDETVLASLGRAVTPVFHPMGIQRENWQAVVSLFTGVVAKEVVVGTMNTLYSQQGAQAFDKDAFSFWGGIGGAFRSFYESFTQINIRQVINPFTANLADGEMSKVSLGNLVKAFGTPLAAFSFLVFVLLYVPCVATIGATRQESTGRWALVSVLWSMAVAYSFAVIIFQLGHLFVAPVESLRWILFSGIFLYGAYLLLAFSSASWGRLSP